MLHKSMPLYREAEGKGQETGADGADKGDAGAKAGGLLDDVDPDADVTDPKVGKDREPLGGRTGEETEPEKEDTRHRPEGLSEADLGETDQETIDKLAKRVKDLRGKLARGDQKAPAKPEDYAFTAPDGVEADLETDANREVLAIFAGAAHKAGLGQEAANALVGEMLQGLAKLQAAPPPAPDLSAEWDKLGGRDKGMKLAQTIAGWGRGLMKAGELTEAEFAEFKIMGGTADGLRVLNKLRKMAGEAPVPIEADPGGDGAPDRSTLRSMLADPKYQTDPAYRAKVDREYAKAFGEG